MVHFLGCNSITIKETVQSAGEGIVMPAWQCLQHPNSNSHQKMGTKLQYICRTDWDAQKCKKKK